MRIDHLKPYALGECSDGEVSAWRKVRLNRMLVDHFLREGHYGSAISLAKSADIVVSLFYLLKQMKLVLRVLVVMCRRFVFV